MNRKVLQGGTALLATLAIVGCSSAEGAESEGSYPDGDIRLVVPWAAGGSGDLTARTLAPLMENELGVDIIVENRTGANGTVGMGYVADQSADGQTLGIMGPEFPFLPDLGYDFDTSSVELIGQATAGPAALAINASLPYETLGDFLGAADDESSKLTYSVSAFGSIWHIIGEGVEEAAGIGLTPVPFDGSAPAIAAAAAGDVDATIDTIGTLLPRVESGELRILATFTDERSPLTPDVPTATEQGVDIQAGSWIGLMVPEGTSAEIKQAISNALEHAVNDESFVETIENANLEPKYQSPEEMENYFDDVYDSMSAWAKNTQ